MEVGAMEAKPTKRRRTVRDLWRGKFVMVILSAFVALTVMTGVATAEEFKQFGVRMRGLVVIPDQHTDDALTAVKIQMAEAPELDLEYFFTRNFSSELILGVVKHDIVVNGVPIGATWLLPPTLTLKYHPFAGSTVSPYIGVGGTWIIPFKERVNGVSDPKIDANLSWAAQAGADVALGNNLYFNLDFKYLNDDTHIRLGGVKHDLDLNPYVIGVGVGYRF
jgi:outer membrane protein